ncbi:hypothetical protein PMAYCL1PPCAC_00878, partial [Pristionchus mayeri]
FHPHIEMSGNACEVKANKQELLPPNTTIRQTDDGTLFYWKFSPSPQRLHVIWKGKEVDAKMPGKVYNTMIHGSAFYFESNDKIYKSVFSSSDGLKVVYLREKIQDEQVLEYGLYTRFKRGHHYLYRACDDPEFGGIQINVGEKLIKDLSVRCIHRRNVICARQHNTNCQKITVQKIGKSIIEIKFAHNLSIHSLDSSPFIYISNFNKIHTLDTESMQFLPPLLITSLHDFEYQRSFHNLKSHFFNPLTSVRKIAGVHDGEITVHAQIGSNDYWVTAELPEEYYDTDEKRTEKIELYIREHLRRYENGNAFPSRFAAEFTIQQLLGTGEFGAVFQAVSDDDLACAVKRVSFKAIAELDDIVRALREVQAMSQFNHIGIVRFYNAWIEIPSDEHRINMDNEIQYHFGAKSVPPHRDSPIFIFIQMELCNGTLKEWLKASRDNPRNITRMKSWFKQIVAAVDYIHEKGFIHRDLKPSNIIFAGEDHLKICDLGIATAFNKENGEEITASYTNVGTPLYKAPEQAYRYNSKVDVFALGLILAEMLTVMTDEERRKLFHRIRHGLPNPRPDPKDVKIFGRVVKSFKNDRNENSDVILLGTDNMIQILSMPFMYCMQMKRVR